MTLEFDCRRPRKGRRKGQGETCGGRGQADHRARKGHFDAARSDVKEEEDALRRMFVQRRG